MKYNPRYFSSFSHLNNRGRPVEWLVFRYDGEVHRSCCCCASILGPSCRYLIRIGEKENKIGAKEQKHAKFLQNIKLSVMSYFFTLNGQELKKLWYQPSNGYLLAFLPTFSIPLLILRGAVEISSKMPKNFFFIHLGIVK